MDKTVVEITNSHITLGQMLKFQNIASSGSEAKFLIQEGKVLVNAEIELRRGRKLFPGDTVTIFNHDYLIARIEGGSEF